MGGHFTKRLLCMLAVFSALALFAGCTPCDEDAEESRAAKPVIYLYPDEDACDETEDAKPVIYLTPESGLDVSVRLDYAGTLTCTTPATTTAGMSTPRPTAH